MILRLFETMRLIRSPRLAKFRDMGVNPVPSPLLINDSFFIDYTPGLFLPRESIGND